MSLAGRMQAAEDRGELERLGLDPALLRRWAAFLDAFGKSIDLEKVRG